MLTFPCCFNLEKVSESPTMGAVSRVAIGGLYLSDLFVEEIREKRRSGIL